MQVSVYLATNHEEGRTRLLVTPFNLSASARPMKPHLWRFYGTLDSNSELFRGTAIELHFRFTGHALVTI
jgi:hypothetical protein